MDVRYQGNRKKETERRKPAMLDGCRIGAVAPLSMCATPSASALRTDCLDGYGVRPSDRALHCLDGVGAGERPTQLLFRAHLGGLTSRDTCAKLAGPGVAEE